MFSPMLGVYIFIYNYPHPSVDTCITYHASAQYPSPITMTMSYPLHTLFVMVDEIITRIEYVNWSG